MIEYHRNNGQQIVTDLRTEIHRVTLDSQRRPIERNSPPNWEMIAVWTFVFLSFASLPFCIYLILAKCFGDWPF